MAYMELEFPGDAEDARVRSPRNISDGERWLSAIAGTALTAYGLSRRRSTGWALTALGAMLVQRGATGRRVARPPQRAEHQVRRPPPRHVHEEHEGQDDVKHPHCRARV